MSKISKRLDIHFAAVAAAAGAGLMANVSTADAAIVYTGGANIPIGADFYGVYLNVVTGASGIPGSAVPGWDLNPWLGSPSIFTNSSIAPGTAVVTSGGSVANLPAGTSIGVGSTFTTGSVGAGSLAGIDPVIVGFRLINETAGNAVQFGWARMRLPTTGVPGIIYDYAYEDTGANINAGAIPAPGSFGLLALGAAALAGRRRK